MDAYHRDVSSGEFSFLPLLNLLTILSFFSLLRFLYFLFLSLYAPRMRSAPRRFSSEDGLYTAAINALARRSYSVYEMRTYLERRADDKDAVKAVLERLKQLDYLDDARYARQFVRLRSELRKQGAFRIARDLRARGVPDRHIEAALAERSPEASESGLVRARLVRRIKLLRGPLDERRVASLYRSLLRAGFSADTIRRELSALTRKSVEELPDVEVEGV